MKPTRQNKPSGKAGSSSGHRKNSVDPGAETESKIQKDRYRVLIDDVADGFLVLPGDGHDLAKPGGFHAVQG